MDALPIQEKNDLPFASENAGAMHACGHDGHTAMLVAAARLLSDRRGALRGAVKFMFQPAEEGGFGAVRMIEGGVLEEPRVDAAFGLHVTAGRYSGEVALRAGATMAAADRFEIEIKGRGGHAARPDQTVDPIVVAAHVITALQTLVSREVPSSEQAVVTVGNLEAGSTYNAIPEVATMKGTFRTFSEDVRAQIRRRLPELVLGIAGALRAAATTKLIPGYPVLVNPAESVAFVRATVAAVLSSEALFDMEPAAGAEDFSYVLQRVPGAFFFLGVRDPAWAELRPNHSPRFDMDESALPVGAALMAATAMRFLA
jgi:amidohydrolase